MPIVSKSLINVRPRPDGFRVREEHIPSIGARLYYSYLVGTEAEATTLMNARDLTDSLQARETDRLRVWVSEGRDIANFVWHETPLNRRRALMDKIVADLNDEVADLDAESAKLVTERDTLEAG